MYKLKNTVAANLRGCEPATAIIQPVLLSRHKSAPLCPAETAKPELFLDSYTDEEKKKKSLDNVVDVVLKGKLEVTDETEITRWLESI